MYQLRDYRAEDFPQLLLLDQLCFPEGISYDRLELSHFISRPQALTILAETNGGEQKQLAGFILVNRERDRSGHIITIDVRAQHRRDGVGTLLMNEVEARLAADKSPAISLEVAIDNKPAIHFYKRHGYSIIKTIPRYYLNSIDALLMTKKL